jgi:hypothetical protein
MAAACGALMLIIISRSGHAAITLAAAAMFAAVGFARARATIRTYLVIALATLLIPIVLYFAAASLGDRVGGGPVGNSSWEERATSLVDGFLLWTNADAGTLVFGLGPGLSAGMIQRTYGIDAVFSVLLVYVYETGLLGLLVVTFIAHQMFLMWRSVKFDHTLLAITLVWVVGVTLTTSYEQLLPLWVTLGLLTVWPAVCEEPVSEPGRAKPRTKVRPRAWFPPLKTTAARGGVL